MDAEQIFQIPPYEDDLEAVMLEGLARAAQADSGNLTVPGDQVAFRRRHEIPACLLNPVHQFPGLGRLYFTPEVAAGGVGVFLSGLSQVYGRLFRQASPITNAQLREAASIRPLRPAGRKPGFKVSKNLKRDFELLRAARPDHSGMKAAEIVAKGREGLAKALIWSRLLPGRPVKMTKEEIIRHHGQWRNLLVSTGKIDAPQLERAPIYPGPKLAGRPSGSPKMEALMSQFLEAMAAEPDKSPTTVARQICDNNKHRADYLVRKWRERESREPSVEI